MLRFLLGRLAAALIPTAAPSRAQKTPESVSPKLQPSARVAHSFRLAGTTFGDRQSIIARTRISDPIVLRREFSNPHDRNAIACCRTLDGAQLGYVPQELSRVFAPLIDRGVVYEAQMLRILGGTGTLSYGVEIRVAPATAPETAPTRAPAAAPATAPNAPAKETGLSIVVNASDRVIVANFLGGGRLVATGWQSGAIRVWDAVSRVGSAVLTGHKGPVTHLCGGSGGMPLVSGGKDGTVRTWAELPGADDRIVHQFNSAVKMLSCTPSRLVLAMGADGDLVLFNLNTGRPVSGPWPHAKRIMAAELSPDGKTLATGAADWVVRLWDIESRKLRAELRFRDWSPRVLAFSPDGMLVAAGYVTGEIRVWEVANGAVRLTMRAAETTVVSLCFAANGNRIAARYESGRIRWLEIGVQPAPVIEGAPEGAGALALGPNDVWAVGHGRKLTTGRLNQKGFEEIWTIEPPTPPPLAPAPPRTSAVSKSSRNGAAYYDDDVDWHDYEPEPYYDADAYIDTSERDWRFDAELDEDHSAEWNDHDPADDWD